MAAEVIFLDDLLAEELASGWLVNRVRPELGAPWWSPRPPIGVCCHYDASLSDAGALSWLLDPRCTLGYNILILDNGRAYYIIRGRAPHAGKTRSSDPTRLPYAENQANGRFYSIALAATAGDVVYPAQLGTLIRLVVKIFQGRGWPLSESWRLTDHLAEAWPRGRKVDVVGWNPALPDTPGNRHRAEPVLDMETLRGWLETART